MSFRKDILAACTVGDLAWLQRSIAGMTSNLITVLNKQGQNALHLAAMHGRFDCVKYMLDHCGIDVNEQSSEARSTALHYCVSESSGASCIQCLKILLERGAKHSIKDADGQTVLHYAAKVGNIKCVKMLLEHGADIAVSDEGGNTPHDLASLYGHHECARLLRALHWAHRKDGVEREKIDSQVLHRARERESSALKTRLQRDAAHDAYTRWMRSKNLPINADHKSEPSCKEARPQSCGACASALSSHCLGPRNETLATPIKISHQQKEKNIRSVGKPEKLFPYSNYPPRPAVPQRKKLCITPRRSQSANLGAHASKRTKHSRSAPPLRTNSNAPVATINPMKPNTEVAGEVSPRNEQGDKQGDDEDDDALFHEVDQVGEFRSSTLPRFISGKQLTQLLQLISSRTIPGTKSTDSLPLSQFHTNRRHAKYRSQFHRRFSLGAIPEGRVVDVAAAKDCDMDEVVELESWNVWGAEQGSNNEVREERDEESKNIDGDPQVPMNPLVAVSEESDGKVSPHKSPPLALAIVNFTWEEGKDGVCTEAVLSPLMPHPLPEHQLRNSSRKPMSRRPSTGISSRTASTRTSVLPKSAPPNRARTALNSELPSSLSFGSLSSKSMVISDCVGDTVQHCDLAGGVTSDAQCIKPVTFVFGGGLVNT